MVRIVLIPLAMLVASLFCSCDSKEKEQLRAENDSLRSQLVGREEMVAVMKDVKLLIDSIDASRKVLRSDLNDGMSYDTFKGRLQSINTYVRETQDRIKNVQSRLAASDHKASAYLMMVDALQSELGIRVQEVNSLSSAVEEYRKQNEGLMKTVQLQQTEMAEMQQKIEAKQQELALLDAKVKEMVNTFKMTEADAYYARAQAIEEAANRTKLAPRKKKETFREALELYKKAQSLGKKEASKDIGRLEKKI